VQRGSIYVLAHAPVHTPLSAPECRNSVDYIKIRLFEGSARLSDNLAALRGARPSLLVRIALRAAAHAADSLRGNGRRDWAFMQSVPPLRAMFHHRPWSPTPPRGPEQS
jgi:hypothetical protein